MSIRRASEVKVGGCNGNMLAGNHEGETPQRLPRLRVINFERFSDLGNLMGAARRRESSCKGARMSENTTVF